MQKKSGIDTAGPITRVLLGVAGLALGYHAYNTNAFYSPDVRLPLIAIGAIYLGGGVFGWGINGVMALWIKGKLKRILGPVQKPRDLNGLIEAARDLGNIPASVRYHHAHSGAIGPAVGSDRCLLCTIANNHSPIHAIRAKMIRVCFKRVGENGGLGRRSRPNPPPPQILTTPK